MIKITEKPILEATTDETYIIGHDAEGVKRIPASAVGGSGGTMFFNVDTIEDENGDWIYTSTKTYSELKTCMDNGILPICIFCGYDIKYLAELTDGEFVFHGVASGYLFITSNNEVEVPEGE